MENIKKVIVLGSLNKDVVFYTKKLPKAGETIESYLFQKYNGGKGGNQAVAIAKMKTPIQLIAAIGEDKYGSELREGLIKYKVQDEYVFNIKSNSGLAFINVDQKGENTIIVNSGANFALENKHLEKAEKLFLESQIFVTQLEIKSQLVLAGLKLAKQRNLLTILTPAPISNFNLDMLEFVDMLIPNAKEFEKIFKTEINDTNVLKISKKYPNIKFIITCGVDGVIFAQNNSIIKYQAQKVKAIDTVAAGDSFVGGLVSQLARNKTIKKAIDFGIKVASICVETHGAQTSIPNYETVIKRYGE